MTTVDRSTLLSLFSAPSEKTGGRSGVMQKLQGNAEVPLSEEGRKKVASDFESLFISQMMEHMFSGDSIGESAFGSEESDEIYKSMMVEQYAKKIASSGGIGIASYIERSLAERALLQAQEVNHEHATQPAA